MSDRFKFRVWDEVNNKFFAQKVLNVLPLEVFLASKHIQQYTGLKDKNGNLIFEGDIVQYNQNSSYDNMDFIAKWSDDKLGFIFQSNSGEQLVNQTPYLNRFKHLEVVGNIFENKELLK
jgi:uncharacterized phage protein (TIGR01671 family)